jgi:radical SAM protein with 4Fe4S-binding SPASM domain
MSNNSEKRLDTFHFEITTTQACNFSCHYCFENDCEFPTDNVVTKKIDHIIEKVKKLLNSEWFKSKFDSIKINFWGGEPSLNMGVIKKVTEAFVDDKTVSFFIFTNGSNIEDLLPILLKFKGRFAIQLSYDGEPVNYRRKTKKGTYTSSIVWAAMDLLHKNKIEFHIKSTIEYSDFNYLPEVWEHFKLIRKAYGNNINYAVTVDYHHIEFEKYKDNVETALVEVARKELKYFKENDRYLSNIFTASKKYCGCGKKMLTVGVDGKAYYCHGCLYSDKKDDFMFGSVEDDDFLDKIKANYEKFYDNQPVVDECETCSALACLRCNVTKYEDSFKDDFNDRWYDFSSQEELCKYYMLAGKIGRAMLNILREE